MPTSVARTPEWLSRPNPGYGIFMESTPSTSTASNTVANSSKKRAAKPGPRRTIARRGTEIFTAVGKEIRWADLIYLKEAWEDKQERLRRPRGEKVQEDKQQFDEDHAQGYRTIKTPVAEDIRQLIISPHSNFLAISTTHTVHIAVLPESSHLTAPEQTPMKLKTYTLGPTTHVTSQPALASALWHPLGVNGSCLVTVTEDAIVRVWELSTADRWSFDKPTLSIDLKKLADGTSIGQDFTASSIGQSRGISPDSIEMEVASACFASRGSGGWAPMTLWIAMREGDVYALCPLLPEKWSPPPTLIPSLSVSIVSKVALTEDDPQADKILAQQQLAWMADLDTQEPTTVEGLAGEPEAEVYTRPSTPGKIPKLQGPFDFELAPEESDEVLDGLLSDIYVIGPKMDSDELMFGEEHDLELDDIDREGLSIGIVCLLTTSGRLQICLNIDGVEARWLPKVKARGSRLREPYPTLLTFQSLDTLKKNEVWEGSWPIFSQDATSRYSLYITAASSITFICLSPWVFRLETELREGSAGTDFRVNLLASGENTTRERIHEQPLDKRAAALAASTLIRDPDLGHFLLTADENGPKSITFALAEDVSFDRSERSQSPAYEEEDHKTVLSRIFYPRDAYQPSRTLDQRSRLPELLERLRHSKHKRLLNEPIRLSPATLTMMAEAHKILGDETHALGEEAASLFRNCERLQVELRAQINSVRDIALRIDSVTGDDIEDGPVETTQERIQQRVEDAARRQKNLSARIEKIKNKVTRHTTRPITEKERAWAEEVETLASKIKVNDEDGLPEQDKEPQGRFYEVIKLKDMLLKQVKDIAGDEENGSQQSVAVPSEIRKKKVAQVMSLLDRETALVEGAKSRLERLSLVG